jgi:hypothetical protein
MNSRDAILKALTPDDMFNQKGLTWRSVSTLAQFASVEPEEVLAILDEHFQNLISVRPNGKHPANGPLVALNEHIHPDPDPQVVITGGNAVGAAIEGVAVANDIAQENVAEPPVVMAVGGGGGGGPIGDSDEAQPMDGIDEFIAEMDEQDHE